MPEHSAVNGWFVRLRQRRALLALSLFVVVADQATKLLADAHLVGRGPVEVIPGLFNLWYSRNAGGLFGSFSTLEQPWRLLLLTGVPLLAIGLIVALMLGEDASDRPTRVGLSLVLGGAVGNLIDRVARGEVIDFLDVYVSHEGLAGRLVAWFGTAHWPTFNIADSAIVVGAGLLMTSLLRPRGDANARTLG